MQTRRGLEHESVSLDFVARTGLLIREALDILSLLTIT